MGIVYGQIIANNYFTTSLTKQNIKAKSTSLITLRALFITTTQDYSFNTSSSEKNVSINSLLANILFAFSDRFCLRWFESL